MRKVQKKRNRCWQCRKKVGLTGIECRCGYVFCATCRHAEAHGCDADYRTTAREHLERENRRAAFKKVDQV